MGHRILMYHAVGFQVESDLQGLFSIKPELFASHMEWLAGLGQIQVLSLSEGLKDLSRPTVSISFDDGYEDNFKVAAPLLLKQSFPFTVFVTSDSIKKHKKGFLTPEDLKEFSSLPGVTIGAHGKSHVPLVKCNEVDLLIELSESKKYLEDLIGKPVITMSYPHGSVDDEVRRAVKKCGYLNAATSFFGINTPNIDVFSLRRTEITGHDSLSVFQEKIWGWWDWYRFKQWVARSA